MFVSIQKCLDRKKKPYITLSAEQKQEISQQKAENPLIRKIKIRVQASKIFLEQQENIEGFDSHPASYQSN